MTHLFVDGLTVVDCSYLHPTRGIVGESWLADIVLSGNLDEEGVVFDFSYAKKAIKGKIDATADHSLIVPTKDPRIVLREKDGISELEYTDDQGRFYQYSCPSQGLCLIDTDVIDQKSVCAFLTNELKQVLPENVESIEINLRVESIDGAFYHYSHGLKKHYGNCQRMAHGHRSRIEIFRNGSRDNHLEKVWADKWSDIYLGTREDLFEELAINGEPYYHFVYEGNQGPFELVIKEEICDIFETDTTVELIAEHLYKELKMAFPEDEFKVRAFEGVEKGALRM